MFSIMLALVGVADLQLVINAGGRFARELP
jgi:hypothetical protein